MNKAIGWVIDLTVLSIDSDLLRAFGVTATIIIDFARGRSRQRTFKLKLLLIDPEHRRWRSMSDSNSTPFNNSMFWTLHL